jgi:hypothetical protein
MDVLADMKHRLSDKGIFSYAVLYACYVYGWDFVKARDFNLGRLPRPPNPVALQIYRGNPHPVPAP